MTCRAALVALACAACATTLHAQESPTTLFFRAGAALPVGDAFEAWETGFSVAAGAGYLDLGPFQLRGDAAFSRFGFDREELLRNLDIPPTARVEIDGGALSVFSLFGVLEWPLAGPSSAVRPYLSLGAGYALEHVGGFTISDPTGSETLEGDNDNAISNSAGAGLRVRLSPEVDLVLDGRYVVIWDFGDPPDLDESYLPIELGVAVRP